MFTVYLSKAQNPIRQKDGNKRFYQQQDLQTGKQKNIRQARRFRQASRISFMRASMDTQTGMQEALRDRQA